MKSCAVLGVGVQVVLGAWLLGSSLGGCGGEAGAPPRTAESTPGESAPAESAAGPVRAPAGDAAPPPEPGAPAASTAARRETDEPPPVPAKDPNAQREVKYVVSPEGLKVEVAGVRFFVAAEARQIGQGWGAKVNVKAEPTDGKSHVLLSPKNGPLAFAAAVFKKGSAEAERIGDERSGEGELTLSSGAPTAFSRQFPEKGGRVLAIGETLDLEVALWGLGESNEDRRPVKQFVHVKMKVEKGKPRALVEPPSTAK